MDLLGLADFCSAVYVHENTLCSRGVISWEYLRWLYSYLYSEDSTYRVGWDSL